MRRLVLTSFAIGFLAALAACYAGPDGPTVSGGSTGGQWSYAKGPHGENCLFFADGTSQYATLAMDCDTVTP